MESLCKLCHTKLNPAIFGMRWERILEAQSWFRFKLFYILIRWFEAKSIHVYVLIKVS